MIINGAVSFPASMKQHAEGEYALKTVDGSQLGKLVVKESGAWGLRPLFQRRGGDPGDYLLVVVDLTSREATLTLGDSSLLDPYQEADQECSFS
jgi:hypothetical protein